MNVDLGMFFNIRFFQRHCDHDLDHVLETSAPPLDLASLAIFRTSIAKHRKKVVCLELALCSVFASCFESS